jgi:chromosome segregation ATPase
MVAVAARIQDRAMQLLLEQTKLNDAKTELQKIQDSARKESQVNDSRRRILLATTNSRNGVELELYKARDKISDYKKLIQKLREETQKIEDQTKKVEAQWKDDVENIYSRCQLEMELYQHSLETSLQANEQRANQRVEQLDQLEARARNLNEEEGALRRACQTLETDIERLEREEEDGDEEVSSLALEVREALAEVSVLFVDFPLLVSVVTEFFHLLSGGRMFCSEANKVEALTEGCSRRVPESKR